MHPQLMNWTYNNNVHNLVKKEIDACVYVYI